MDVEVVLAKVQFLDIQSVFCGTVGLTRPPSVYSCDPEPSLSLSQSPALDAMLVTSSLPSSAALIRDQYLLLFCFET